MTSPADHPNLYAESIKQMASDEAFTALSETWMQRSIAHKYSYHFTWMGRPIIQYPQDLIAMQELIWQIQPDVVVETGIAHGGSLVFYASVMATLPGERQVIGVDIDIRPHNRRALEDHPIAHRITLIEGSSVAQDVVSTVYSLTEGKRVLLVLDSNHTHSHVLKELEVYSPLVRAGSYVVVFDTIVAKLPSQAIGDRPWGPHDNPLTAVKAFLETTDRFVVDEVIENKLLLTAAPGGYLRCIKDPD